MRGGGGRTLLLLSHTHLNAIDLLNGCFSRIKKKGKEKPEPGSACSPHSVPCRLNPPHSDAIFGVVESLQSAEVVGQGVSGVPGYDGDNHRRRLHFRLLRVLLLRKVTLGSREEKGP